MSIASLADYRSAMRQEVVYRKNPTSWGGSRYYSNVLIGGSPPAASAPTNNTNGIVPTNASSGYPTIYPFSGTGYITAVEASLSHSAAAFIGYRYIIADLLWYAGSYNTSNVSLSSQPSFSSRLPGGSYQGLQLWSEGIGGAGNTTTFDVGYTNQSGTTGRQTGAFDINPAASSNVGLEAYQFPLQAGDTGVQKVDSVTVNGGLYSANLMILRPLVRGRVEFSRGGIHRQWFDRTGAVQIFADSALISIVSCEGSPNPSILATVPIELAIEIASL